MIDAAPQLSELLSSCPNLTLLVTSRELLRIQGEVEYAVPPLAEPEAVCSSASGRSSSHRRRSPNSAAVSITCRWQSSCRSPSECPHSRADPGAALQRLDLLKGGRDTDPRQQTLRATIEWSNELLTPEELQLFARLSVFAGCTLEAVEEVADADLDTLQSLVEKSLVRFTDGRYWMLETIREYASERLRRRMRLRS